MAEGRRWGMALVAVGLALALGDCGGDSTGPTRQCIPPQTGTYPDCRDPVTCTQTTVYSESGPIPALTVALDQFSVPDSGRLDMTLDWTNASSLMGLYLVPANTCTTIEEFNAGTCNFLVRSEPPGAKPRKVSASNFQAGNYRVLIANFSDEDESAAVQVVLSKGTGCAALTGAQPSALSREDASGLVVERMEQR